jgi:hypothetical protein
MPRPPRSFSPHAALTYKEPTLVRFGRYAMTIGLVSVVFLIIYVVSWLGISMFLRSSIQDWFEARRSEGYVATYDDKKARISGFPFTVRASLEGVTFAPPQSAQGIQPWSWATDKIDFAITPLPWTLGTLHVDLKAEQSLTQGSNRFEGRADTLDLAVNWTAEGIPNHIDIKIKDLLLSEVNSSREIQVVDLNIKTKRQSSAAYEFDVMGEGMKLPVGIKGLGYRLNEIIFRGHFTENFGQNGLGKAALQVWRDAGGTMEVSRMQFDYGPLIAQGNGTMALDGDMQLVGAFSARIQGFFQTVDRLQNSGVVRGPDASMAKVVLGMLSKQPKNGGPATISLPLTLQDRAFYAGPVRLADLPELHW